MVKVIFGGLLPLIVMAANFVGYAVCSTLFRGMIEPPTLMLMMLLLLMEQKSALILALRT